MEHIRPTTMAELDYVAAHMREEDIEEVMALGYTSPADALLDGYELGICYTLVDPLGEAAGLIGVAEDRIWLLGTPSIEKYAITFLRQSKPVLQRLYEESGNELLWNVTYKHNHVHHNWLKWLGFIFLKEEGNFIEFARLRGK